MRFAFKAIPGVKTPFYAYEACLRRLFQAAQAAFVNIDWGFIPVCWVFVLFNLCVGLPSMAQPAPLTPAALQTALAAHPGGESAMKLADRVREAFGKEALTKGAVLRTEGLTAAWAIETPGAQKPQIVSEDGAFTLPLTRLSGTDVYAAAVTLPDGTAMRWHCDVDGTTRGGGQFELYLYPPETREQTGVPHGTLTQQPKWKSRIYPGTERDWWIYVPAQYKPETPACVMIFQDGGGMKNYVPTVLDNLIARGDMPVTVSLFVNPGSFPDNRMEAGKERSIEYDTLSERYVRFLLEEILPEAEKTINLRHDAASRAVAGISSGGICAFTVAWQRPDQFSKVMSWVGSFTNLAAGLSGHDGGHNYPAMIRRTPRKPIRVFLQDGANDLDNFAGNWPLANQQMAKALAFAGYDYQFVFGHGFHSDAHGRALLPDALRWLWKDYKSLSQ